MRRFVLVLLAVLALPAPALAGAEAQADPVAYRPPVDAAPLIELFRPPAHQFGAGNRGVDYGTEPGQPVHAAAAGEVVYAGTINHDNHVVVLHADGIRTSYSFLAEAAVRRGDNVAQGDPVGVTHATKPLHFGARAGEAYLDPLVLLGQRAPTPGTPRTRLVVDPDLNRPLAEAVERSWLERTIRDALGHAVDWAQEMVDGKVDFLVFVLDAASDLGIPMPVHIVAAAIRWEASLARCTPAGTPRPRPHPPGRRRIALLVGGLGSATGEGAILDVDTEGLGYAERDVHEFSYTGTPADRDKPYARDDTTGDIDEAGERLAAHIGELQRAHPDAVVDVLAHSLGGLVARSAVTTHRAAPTTVVTLGTPHQGVELASAAAGLATSTTGGVVLDGIGWLAPGIDPSSPAVQQMSETSDFIARLPDRGWSATTHVVSIAARRDAIVANHQSRLDGPDAHATVVDVEGIGNHHDRLPGTEVATTEIARALGRETPTCRSLHDTLLDELTGRAIGHAQDHASLAAAYAALFLDARAMLPGNPDRE